MAYNPLNWQSGDIVTAEKLNQMKGGVLFITPTDIGDGALSLGYSYNDILAMVSNNVLPVLLGNLDEGDGYEFVRINSMGIDDGGLSYWVALGEYYIANTATDPLVYTPEPGPI